jgi:hypothetical protein
MIWHPEQSRNSPAPLYQIGSQARRSAIKTTDLKCPNPNTPTPRSFELGAMALDCYNGN